MCALELITEALEEVVDDMPRRMTSHVARNREIEYRVSLILRTDVELDILIGADWARIQHHQGDVDYGMGFILIRHCLHLTCHPEAGLDIEKWTYA